MLLASLRIWPFSSRNGKKSQLNRRPASAAVMDHILYALSSGSAYRTPAWLLLFMFGLLPLASAQYYTAQFGPYTSGSYVATSVYSCGDLPPDVQYLTESVAGESSSNGLGTGIASFLNQFAVDYSHGDFRLKPPFVLKPDGSWNPASVSGLGSNPRGGGSDEYLVITSLSRNGLLNGTFAVNFFQDGYLRLKVTVDLNTGKFVISMVEGANDASTLCRDKSTGSTSYLNNTVDGTVQLRLVPADTINSLVTLNPFSCLIMGDSNCTDPPSFSPDQQDVTKVQPANAISSDGVSAAVVLVHSNSGDPVTIDVSANGVTGAIGGLTLYDRTFLSPQTQRATPQNQITIDRRSPDSYFCEPDSTDLAKLECYFLALLWAPQTMPGGGALSSTGGYGWVPLTLTATQDDIPIQTTINLQPPPLVLVHGIWSEGAVWNKFEDWLHFARYPHDLLFPADYGPDNYLAYSDPVIQNIFETTVLRALYTANGLGPDERQSVVAHQVDVVAHSMGGLVTRHFINNNLEYPVPWTTEAPDLIHQLITIGTPHQGTPMATALATNQNNAPWSSLSLIKLVCIRWGLPQCTLGDFMAHKGKKIAGGVLSLELEHPGPDQVPYSSIVGLKPTSAITATERYLNWIIQGFLGPTVSIDVLLGGNSNDTLVSQASQTGSPLQTTTINNIVHSDVCVLCLYKDMDETSSPEVFQAAANWLMGGTTPFQSATHPASPTLAAGVKANTTADPSNLVLDLTGYTEVPASNVTFLPVTGSTLTVNVPTQITASSSTKTITEILLFPTISDSNDDELLYSTQPPFSIGVTPTHLGTATFAAFVLFSDVTFAQTTLSYTCQALGAPFSVSLVNMPVSSLAPGAKTVMGATAIFSTGPVDVSQNATYKARSGTTNVFSRDSSGTITANGPGTDWLDVSYGGAVASAPISVDGCRYSLSPAKQLVDYLGGTASLQVTTGPGCFWTIDIGGATWLSAANASGTGSGTVTLTATPNSSGSDNTAIITIADQAATVAQPGTACSYTLDQTQITIPGSGGTGTIGVTTSCPISPMSNASWLTATGLASSVGYFAPANISGNPRSGTIAIGGQSAVVTQAVAKPDFAVYGPHNSQNVTRGQSTTFTLEVAPLFGFNQSVALICSGNPSLSTCGVSPSSLTLAGTATSTATVTITTTAPANPAQSLLNMFSSLGSHPAESLEMQIAFWSVLLATMGLATRLRRRTTSAVRICVAICTLSLLLLVPGCGAGGNSDTSSPGTPVGNHTLTLTATDTQANVSHSVTVTLVVGQ